MTATRDKLGRQVVVVTGMGVVTSLGAGKTDNWARLTAGESGLRTIKRFSTEGLRTTVAGTIDFIDCDPICAPALSQKFAECAADEAVAQAGLGSTGDFPGPLFLAVAPVEIEWPQRTELAKASGANDSVSYDDLIRASATGTFRKFDELFLFGSIADHLADRFGTRGSPVSLSTACASGATAIQLGVEAIRRGEADAALCIGTDGSVNIESLVRFSLLSALSTQNDPPQAAAKPFSKNRDGFVMAEGAGVVILEELEFARKRGAPILAEVLGYGMSADGTHMTAPCPEGKGAGHAMSFALRDAKLNPDEIQYVNAHGTSTPLGDKAETLAMKSVFQEHAKKFAVSSTKSQLGHLLGASGGVEFIISTLALRDQVAPPTINLDNPDPDCDLDYVPNVARSMKLNRVMSNSFGFGGHNACLVLGKAP